MKQWPYNDGRNIGNERDFLSDVKKIFKYLWKLIINQAVAENVKISNEI